MKVITKILAMFCVSLSMTVFAGNLLNDGALTSENGWFFWLDSSVTNAGGFGKQENKQGIFKSPDIGAVQNPSRIQLIKPLKIDSDNKKYTLKLKVKTDKAGAVEYSYGLLNAPFTSYAGGGIDISVGEKTYECVVTVNNMDDNKQTAPCALRLLLGAFKDANVTISDVSLEPIN